MAETLAPVRDLRPLSERMLRPLRRCPDCLGTEFREVDDEEVCVKCGLVLAVNHVQERGNDGFEQETHSAAPPLEFLGGNGRPLSEGEYEELMRRKIIGEDGDWNLAARVPNLMRAAAPNDWFTELIRPSLQYASEKLEELGLYDGSGDAVCRRRKRKASSPILFGNSMNESHLGQVAGGAVGMLIRRFYRHLAQDLSALGYAFTNGRKSLGLVSLQHQVITENAIGFWLLSLAANGDDRLLRRALGFIRVKDRHWKFRKDAPRLALFNPDLARLVGAVAQRPTRFLNRTNNGQ